MIPPHTDLVIPVVGLDCLGKPAREATVFRLSRFLALTGLSEGTEIDAEAVATAITHAQGIAKGTQPSMRLVPFLNKVDALRQIASAEYVARLVFEKRPGIRAVVAGQLKPEIWLTIFRA